MQLFRWMAVLNEDAGEEANISEELWVPVDEQKEIKEEEGEEEECGPQHKNRSSQNQKSYMGEAQQAQAQH